MRNDSFGFVSCAQGQVVIVARIQTVLKFRGGGGERSGRSSKGRADLRNVIINKARVRVQANSSHATAICTRVSE